MASSEGFLKRKLLLWMFRLVSLFQPLLWEEPVILASRASFGYCLSYSDFQCLHPSSSVTSFAQVPGGDTALMCLHTRTPGFPDTCAGGAFFSVFQAFIPLLRSPVPCLCRLLLFYKKEQLHLLPDQWHEK